MRTCKRGHTYDNDAKRQCDDCVKHVKFLKADHIKTLRRLSDRKSADRIKGYNLLKTYGITLAQYEEISLVQNHKCAICKKKDGAVSKLGKNRDLAVDHCHQTGKVRGLLCSPCNSGIGQLGDSIERLETALEYLRKHKT